MKIAIITDIHHGPRSGTPGRDPLAFAQRFAAWANEIGADLLLDLGDRIDDVDHDQDFARSQAVIAALSGFNGPRLHALGNHDVAHLSLEDHAALLGHRPCTRALDVAGHRIILFQPDVSYDARGFLPVGAAALAELLALIEASPLPVVIGSHVPFTGNSLIGNSYFERHPHQAFHPDHQAVRRAVEATGKVRLWLSGHQHWNLVQDLNGLIHATVQSVTETSYTAPHIAASHALATLSADEIGLEVFGRQPLRVTYPRTSLILGA